MGGAIHVGISERGEGVWGVGGVYFITLQILVTAWSSGSMRDKYYVLIEDKLRNVLCLYFSCRKSRR